MTLQTLIKHDKIIPNIDAPAVFREKLSTKQADALFTRLNPLCQQAAPAKGHRVRLGVNNAHRLSQYRYIREYDMPRSARQSIRSVLQDIGVVTATHWLLHFEVGEFLDPQDAWENVPTVVDFEAIALRDGQRIILAGESYLLNKGDSIRWHPSLLHEVPPTEQPATRLGMMVFSHLEGEA